MYLLKYVKKYHEHYDHDRDSDHDRDDDHDVHVRSYEHHEKNKPIKLTNKPNTDTINN